VDDSRPRARWRQAIVRQTSGSCLFLLVLTLNGCSSPEAPPLPSWPTADFSELVKSVAALRRLPLKHNIVSEDQSAIKSEFATTSARMEDYFGSPVSQVERAYKSIGLLPNDADLGQAMADYKRVEELVKYDAVNGTLALARDSAGLGAPFAKTNPRAAREAPAVLGIVKALQEQHFRWSAVVSAAPLEDRRLAFRAVAAGDALLTLIARSNGKERLQLSPADIDSVKRIAAEIDKLGASLPDFLRHRSAFPYREGVSFVYWASATKGWDGVNSLYANPPLTTAQILHPEKYFVRRVGPGRFCPAGLMRRMGGSPVIEESFGEYYTCALLQSVHAPKYAADTAAGWRGDQMFFFQAGGNSVTAWFSVWEGEQQAHEFYNAFQTVLERGQRFRFRPTRDENGNVLTADTHDRGAFLLQMKGSSVLVLNAVPAGHLAELQEEAWKDLEIDLEPAGIRFESARFSDQLSLSKR